jgi:DNA-binding GntR family transcriptional regulator
MARHTTTDKAAARTRLQPLRTATQGSPVPAVMRDALRDGSRTEYVYRYVLQAIRDGRFRQGDRIREEDVATLLGVSRTPVREALRQLQSQGLIEFTAGRGAGIVELSGPQILELYAMREILDGAAARMAAEHATPAEISYLSHLLQEFSQSKDPARLAAVNIAFHRCIGEAAHNRYLMQSLDKLRDFLALLQGTTFSVKGRPTTAAEEHRAIFEAIQARNPDAAEQAARSHIRSARSTRMQMLPI